MNTKDTKGISNTFFVPSKKCFILITKSLEIPTNQLTN